MTYKVCSSKQIIARVFRDFKPSNSGWIEDAIEWIGDAIDIMKCAPGYCETYRDLNVVDYKVEIPCDLESILGIQYKGARLRYNGGLAMQRTWKTNIPLGLETYTLNPGTIETSFAEGCIRLHYWGLPVDCDGYPMVIDSAKYKEALTWFILMKMMGRGFKHQVFNYKDAKTMWETMYPRAQNDCKMPNIDQMENWKHNWVGVVKNLNRADNFYQTYGSGYNPQAFPPGSNLQTFPILGNNDD